MAELFNRYMYLCAKVLKVYGPENLEIRERLCIPKLLSAFREAGMGNMEVAQERLKEAGECYYSMKETIELISMILILGEEDEKAKKQEAKAEHTPLVRMLSGEQVEMPAAIDKRGQNHGRATKVLHGTMEVCRRTLEISCELKKRGVDSRVLNYISDYTGRREDYVLDVKAMQPGSYALSRVVKTAAYLIEEFDCFNFHYGTSLMLDRGDLKAISTMEKKLFMSYYGDDARLYSLASKLSPYVDCVGRDDDEIKRKLEYVAQYTPMAIACDWEVREYLKHFFSRVDVVNPIIDLETYKPSEMKPSEAFTIVHAPTNEKAKGTEYILKVVEELKGSYDIDFKLVKGLTREKAREEYRRADLVIDQLLMGTYGRVSIEAMALGKPVMCWISDFMEDIYPNPPIIRANPENIRATLEYVLKNRDMLPHLGSEGRSYVEKNHNAEKEIKKLIRIYKSKGV